MTLMDQTDALFFGKTGLDKDNTLAIVADCLNGADDGDLFLEMRHSEMLGFDDGRLKTAHMTRAPGSVCGPSLARQMRLPMQESYLNLPCGVQQKPYHQWHPGMADSWHWPRMPDATNRFTAI